MAKQPTALFSLFEANDQEDNPKVDDYIGLRFIPFQILREAKQKTYYFSLMVIGSAGLGKSTFINSIFNSKIHVKDQSIGLSSINKAAQITATKVAMNEHGINLNLTVYDTPGFGDSIDNTHEIKIIEKEIEKHFEEYLNEELSLTRKLPLVDTRIHCCVYFINPNCGLREIDIEAMKKIKSKINIIPVIGKADTLTLDERASLKSNILETLKNNGIITYDFPIYSNEIKSKTINKLKSKVPFSIVSSDTLVEINQKMVYGRKYPWGIIESENFEHSDLLALKILMLTTHLKDLIDVTHSYFYESYRRKKLAGLYTNNKLVFFSNNQLTNELDEEKKNTAVILQEKEKKMQMLIELKMREKYEKLKNLELSLIEQNKYANKLLSKQKRVLDVKRSDFEKDQKAFESSFYGLGESFRRMIMDMGFKFKKYDNRKLMWNDEIQIP